MLRRLTPADWTQRKRTPKVWVYETIVEAGVADVSVLIESPDRKLVESARLVVKQDKLPFRILPASAVAKAGVTPGEIVAIEAVEPPQLLSLYFSPSGDTWPVTASVLPKSMQGQPGLHRRMENPVAELAERLTNNDLAGAIAILCIAQRSGGSEEMCTASVRLILQKMVDMPLLRDPAIGAFIISQALFRP